MSTLLIASGGGHLKQLHGLLNKFEVTDDRLWVTFDTGLSRSLLTDEDVEYAPYAHPHDVRGSLRDIAFALKLFRKRKFDRVISTGANLAVCFLPFASFFGAKAIYIETATRTTALSLTGRVIDRIPGIARYCQSPLLANDRWTYIGSVFDGFRARHKQLGRRVSSVVVTVGSNDSYGFDRLINHLQSIIPEGVKVTWQIGDAASRIPGALDSIDSVELDQAMKDADAVIAHAGTGSALSALEAGKFPVLVIRRSAHNEHIDDHQEFTANRLATANLALPAEADDLTWADVEAAASWYVTKS